MKSLRRSRFDCALVINYIKKFTLAIAVDRQHIVSVALFYHAGNGCNRSAVNIYFAFVWVQIFCFQVVCF